MDLSFISYQGTLPEAAHEHAQIVLAIEGSLEIEVGGKSQRLDPDHCAFVPTGALHSQLADKKNSFLVVNCQELELGNPFVENLAERIFVEVPPTVKQLINVVVTAQEEKILLNNFYNHWAQLLVNALGVPFATRQQSMIAKCIATVEASLAHEWTVQEMAKIAGLSQSRFYTVFFEKMKKTPQNWLTGMRIKQVQQWLTETDLPIADLAQRAGYSDQSALTRAMMRITGSTPAAYKKRELRSKK